MGLGLASGDRIYAIGDIHGRSDLLDRLHARIRAHAADEPPGRRVVVHLGDYVDRGPDSRGVIDRVMASLETGRFAGPLTGFDCVALLGNHDAMMRDFLSDPLEIGPGWLMNGAAATLASYGVEAPRRPDDAKALLQARLALLQALPPAHRRFLETLAPMHREGRFLFVHAGIRPGVALDRQAVEDLIWIREEFLHSTADHGAIVVHGHSIAPEPEFRPNRIGIDTGAYRSGCLTAVCLSDITVSVLQT